MLTKNLLNFLCLSSYAKYVKHYINVLIEMSTREKFSHLSVIKDSSKQKSEFLKESIKNISFRRLMFTRNKKQ